MTDETGPSTGMPIRTLAELAAPDERTTRFTPFGLGSMPAERAAEFQQQVIAGADLVADVPDDTRRAYERLRTVYAHGILCYEIFTVVHDQAVLLLELALGERLLAFYDGEVPLFMGDTERPFRARRFDEVREALRDRKGEYADCSLRLTDGPPMKKFRGYLSDLFEWARGEGLLHGQRNRLIEHLLVDMRNDAAHPVSDHLIGPPDTSRILWDVAQIINRIWGSATPGGRFYPAPFDRYVFVIAWDEVGGNGVTWAHAETLLDQADPWPKDWRYVLVRAGEHEHLSDYATTFEATSYPVDFLWGPGDRDAAIEWYMATAPCGDVVTDYLDRWFVVRHDAGITGQPLRPATFLGIPKGSRDGTWHLVKADFPGDARIHLMHERVPGADPRRPCETCHATPGPSGGWGVVERELAVLVPGAEADTSPPVDVAALWRGMPPAGVGVSSA
jgi:hypothetical protein